MQNTKNEIYRHYLAIDYSQKTVSIAHMDATGLEPKVSILTPELKAIKDYLKKYPGKKILTIEETTASHWLYVELRDSVDKVLICNPYRNSLLSEGPKTDKIDARKLCLLLRGGFLKEVYHSMDKFYEIRKLVSSYDDFINASVRLKNQRSAMFRGQGKDHKREKILDSSAITKFITEHQNSLIENIKHIRKEYELKFRQIRKDNKTVSQLVKISGIGDKLALAILAVVIDAERFNNKYKYYSYCGLALHERESGTKKYGKKQTRHNRSLKRAYKIATTAAIGGNNDIRAYYEYLLENKYSSKKARHEISRYIAKVTYAVMKNKKEYRAYQWRESGS